MSQINAGRRFFAFTLLLTVSLLLSACKGYQYTFNETVVRSPTPLYTDFQVADPNLKNCLDQALQDILATAPDQLTQLNCSHAGIETLEGLQVFHKLQKINLSHNNLSDIKALGLMGQIELLLLSDNQLESVTEILTLPKLQRLDLSNNPHMRCTDARQLQKNYSGELQLPEHCH